MVKQKQVSKLDDFRSMVDGISDPELLKAGQGLVRDLITLANIKEQVQALEATLTEGGRAVFYFFVADMEGEEVSFAAERISGRLKRVEAEIEKKKKAEDAAAAKAIAETNEAADSVTV